MRKVLWALPILLVLTLISCLSNGTRVGGDPVPPEPPLPPSNLRVVDEGDGIGCRLFWTASPGPVDGYLFEWQDGTGGFLPAYEGGMLDWWESGIYFRFPQGTPELQPVRFRVRATRAGQHSAYSNEAAFTTRLREPVMAGAPVMNWVRGGVEIRFSANSSKAEWVKVERTTYLNGAPGAWVELARIPAQESPFVDELETLTGVYAYRLTNLKDTHASLTTGAWQIWVSVPAPVSVSGLYDFDRSGIRVSWETPVDRVDQVRLERSDVTGYPGLPEGPWVPLVVPEPDGKAFLDDGAMAGRSYRYRVALTRKGATGGYKETAQPTFAGLGPVQFLSASINAEGRAKLSIHNPFTGQQQVRLERAPSDGRNAPSGVWSPIAVLPGDAREYEDSGVEEGASYLYRAVNLRGSLESSPTRSADVTVPLRPPTGLTVAAAPEGMVLTWTNESRAAEHLEVLRSDGTEVSQEFSVATLTPQESRFTDRPPGLGYFTYRVVARKESLSAWSNSSQAVTPNPGGALALVANPVGPMKVADARLHPSGDWVFGVKEPAGVWSGGNPWPARFPTNVAQLASRFVDVDPLGDPHWFYLAPGTGGGKQALMHEVFRSGAWVTEAVGREDVFFGSSSGIVEFFTWGLGSEGGPRVVKSHVDENGAPVWSYLWKPASGWEEERLPITGSACAVSVDAAGKAHLLVGSFDALKLLRRGSDGWTAEDIPTGPVEANWGGFWAHQWLDEDNGWVCFVRGDDGQPGDHKSLMMVEKRSGQWGQPFRLGGTRADFTRETVALAPIGPEGRMAVACQTSRGVRLFHRDAEGWHETLVAPPLGYGSRLRLGFDGQGRIRLLFWTGDSQPTGFQEVTAP